MRSYSDITPEIAELAEKVSHNNHIAPEMYEQYNVKRGLRDENGNGVVTGLTEISQIISKERLPDGTEKPCHGKLMYRGINMKDFAEGFMADGRFGFEEATYLLLFSELPNRSELYRFKEMLASYRSLPPSFVRDMILKAPSNNVMNMLSRSVLALYSYDDRPDDISAENVLRQSIQLIAMFPLLAIYSYLSYQHYYEGKTLYIRNPDPDLSTAENLLYLLREDGRFTRLEARVLDLALVLHAEHGGGNNSSFTTHVVTSSGTDTYSAIAAALGSLKGPRHGGANIKVMEMFADMKSTIDVRDKDAIRDYLTRLLDRQVFDRSGLIYGMGHAVYSLSDPRADMLKKCAKQLSAEKGMEEVYQLYETVAEMAGQLIAEKRKIYKGVSPNVDFYSGMVYQMLGLPVELYTPIFAVSRISGWCAHRMEEIENAGKIIRPAYIGVKPEQDYQPLSSRS